MKANTRNGTAAMPMSRSPCTDGEGVVEAASNSFDDLLTAVNAASNLVANAGGGQVSMSWGGSEFPFEKKLRLLFHEIFRGVFRRGGRRPGRDLAVPPLQNVVSAGGTQPQSRRERQLS